MIKKTIAGMLAISTLIAALPITSATTVSAEGSYTVPELSLENKSVPETDSFKFVNQMGAGFNLGNTFDAIDNSGAVEGDANMYLQTSWLSDGEAGETTHETIDAIKNAGFSTVRIPVSWHNHLDADFNINPDWMAKVSDIVDYSLSQGLYVILNIHHDNEKASGFTSPDYDPSWAAGNKDCYIYPDKEHLDSSINYVTKIWEQLGAEFKDCDDHLVFETMNEPRQVGNIHEWWYADDDCCHEALECITKINQAAVDTIRNAGGKTTVTGTQKPNETTTTTTNTDVQPPAGDTLFQVWMAGSIGVDDFWGNGNKGQTAANITGNGTYTTSFQVSSEADTISCLVLDSDIDIFKYASKDSADPIADSGIQMKIESVMVDGKPISYTGPSDGAYRLGDSGTSLRYNILNTWTPTNKVSDIASKVKVSKSVSVKFTISGLPDSGVTTSESKPGTTESSTQTTVSSSETTTVSQKTTTTAETSSATATTEKSQPSETSTSATTTASSAKPSETTTESAVLASIFGDINLDSKVDITDAVLLNKKAAGQVDLNAQATANADCNSDKEVNGEDAIVLLQFLVQIIKTLPATK